jgi:hypothetical protein
MSKLMSFVLATSLAVAFVLGTGTAKADPYESKFGFYPLRLYGFSPKDGVLEADFYFWLSVPKGKYATEKDVPIEAANGESLHCDGYLYNPTGSDPKVDWFWFRCRSKFYHSYESALYPFDVQRVRIEIENSKEPLGNFKFSLAPAKNFKVRDGESVLTAQSFPAVAEYRVVSGALSAETHNYQTDWGIQTEDLSVYSRATMTLELHHSAPILLLSLTFPGPLFAFLAWLIGKSKQDLTAKVQAQLGTLAATAAQHYAFLTSVQSPSIFQFAHLYFVITYAVIGALIWATFAADAEQKKAEDPGIDSPPPSKAKAVTKLAERIYPVAFLLLAALHFGLARAINGFFRLGGE